MDFTKERTRILNRESNFLKTFIDIFKNIEVAAQDSEEDIEEEEVELDENFDEKDKKALLKFNSNKKSRAESLSELNQRLQNFPKNRGLTSAEKKFRNALKKQKRKEKLKKANLQFPKNKSSKVVVNTTSKVKEEIEETKPTSEVTNGLVYSKIDFPSDEVKIKVKKDPKKTLEKLKKQKEVITMLRESGEVGKAVQIKSKSAFVSALAKASGEKVLDDPILLQKTIKKKEQKVKQSKRKWDNRLEKVTKLKDDRQKKRQENIDKRKKSKKDNKVKKATKRGRISV